MHLIIIILRHISSIVFDTRNFAKFRKTDHPISIMVASPQDCIQVFFTGVKAVFLQVCCQSRHINQTLLSGHIPENLHFLPIRVLLCQFLLGFLCFTIEIHFLIEQSCKKGLDFIWQHAFAFAKLFSLELGCEAPRSGYLT